MVDKDGGNHATTRIVLAPVPSPLVPPRHGMVVLTTSARMFHARLPKGHEWFALSKQELKKKGETYTPERRLDCSSLPGARR